MGPKHDRPDDEQAAPGRPDEVPSAAPPVEAAEEAAPTLEQLRAERDDLLGRLQRVSADYLNYQKRVQRDVQEARSRGVIELAKAVIDVLDDLERAIEHAKANHDSDDPLLIGTKLVHDKALVRLRQFGIEPMQTEGRPFDPRTQDALMRQPTDQAEPMTVLKEVQKGYAYHGRTIRPAKVIVAAPPEAPASQGKPVDEPTE